MKRQAALIVLWTGAAAPLPAQAQTGARAEPHIGYVYPAGGSAGETIQVTVGGQFLAGAIASRATGDGIETRVVGYDRPLTPRQAMEIRDKLEEARKRLPGASGRVRPGAANPRALMALATEAGISLEQLRKLAEFQRSRTDPKRQPNPQLEEKVSLQIRIDPRAAPGVRELRLTTPAGATNPVRFEVSNRPEYREMEPNDATAEANSLDSHPAVLNGQILPGDVDRFAFTARKGARIVVFVRARELMPFLADAVPGWFQPAIAIRAESPGTSRGAELAYADDFRFHPDPVLCFVPPADGRYILEIHDALYRGREDFVYRISLGEIPFLTSIFPLGGPAGAEIPVALSGWNLPAATMRARPGSPVTLEGEPARSLPFAADSLPEAFEQEPNGTAAAAQRLSVPVILNGRIERPGDVDLYAFKGAAHQRIVADVMARRLGSPLDSRIRLLDSRGKPLAASDDVADPAFGLVVHQADSHLEATLPSRGQYFLAIEDTQNRGGGEFGYRLRVSPPRPDFELRFTPSSLSVRAGETIPLTVHIIGRDGFSSNVTLSLKDAPPGLQLSGAWIPSGQERIRCTLTARLSTAGPASLRLEGRAVIAGREVVRTAVPCEEMMQAFAYHHLVPAEEALITVYGRARPAAGIPRTYPVPIRLIPGETTRVPLSGLPSALIESLDLALSDPPEGISLEVGPANALGIRVDGVRVRPGLRGNLLVEGWARGAAARPRRPILMLPAIPFEVAAASPSPLP